MSNFSNITDMRRFSSQIHNQSYILKHLKKKPCLAYFDQGLKNGTLWLNSPNLTVGQARTRRREKLVKSEKETTKLSALWPKSSDTYEENE